MDSQFVHYCMMSRKKGSVLGMGAKERIDCLPDSATKGLRDVPEADYPELLYCHGLDEEQMSLRLEALVVRGREHGLLCFGAEESDLELIREWLPGAVYHSEAHIAAFTPDKPLRQCLGALIVSESREDYIVSEETAITCEVMRLPAERLYRVGEQRTPTLLANREALREAGIVVVVSGQDSSLASLIKKLTHRPVLAVPTSRRMGDGVFATMMAMGETCASDVTLCGTDNGYGAAWLAVQRALA